MPNLGKGYGGRFRFDPFILHFAAGIADRCGLELGELEFAGLGDPAVAIRC